MCQNFSPERILGEHVQQLICIGRHGDYIVETAACCLFRPRTAPLAVRLNEQFSESLTALNLYCHCVVSQVG